MIEFTDTQCTLKAEEQEIAQLLGDAWSLYCKLSVEHPYEKTEFGNAINACQNIILSRPAVRALVDKGQGYKGGDTHGKANDSTTQA